MRKNNASFKIQIGALKLSNEKTQHTMIEQILKGIKNNIKTQHSICKRSNTEEKVI